jgi:hypothetical protein
MLNGSLTQTPNAGTAKNTAAGFTVKGIESVMEDLRSRGVAFEEYDFGEMASSENGLMTMGNIKAAWFKDSRRQRRRAQPGGVNAWPTSQHDALSKGPSWAVRQEEVEGARGIDPIESPRVSCTVEAAGTFGFWRLPFWGESWLGVRDIVDRFDGHLGKSWANPAEDWVFAITADRRPR